MDKKIEEGVRKGLLAMLGLASLTKEKAQQIAKELIKKGEMSKKDVGSLARALAEKAKKGRKIAGDSIKAAKKIMEKIDVPTRKEFNELKKMMEELKKKAGRIKKK